MLLTPLDEDLIGGQFGSVRENDRPRQRQYWEMDQGDGGGDLGASVPMMPRIKTRRRSPAALSSSRATRWFALVTMLLLSLLLFLAVHVRSVVQKAGKAKRLQDYSHHVRITNWPNIDTFVI